MGPKPWKLGTIFTNPSWCGLSSWSSKELIELIHHLGQNVNLKGAVSQVVVFQPLFIWGDVLLVKIFNITGEFGSHFVLEISMMNGECHMSFGHLHPTFTATTSIPKTPPILGNISVVSGEQRQATNHVGLHPADLQRVCHWTFLQTRLQTRSNRKKQKVFQKKWNSIDEEHGGNYIWRNEKRSGIVHVCVWLQTSCDIFYITNWVGVILCLSKHTELGILNSKDLDSLMV